MIKLKDLIIENWWTDLSSKEQSDYIQKHPKSQKALDTKKKEKPAVEFDQEQQLQKLQKNLITNIQQQLQYQISGIQKEKQKEYDKSFKQERKPHYIKTKDGILLDEIKDKKDYKHFLYQFVGKFTYTEGVSSDWSEIDKELMKQKPEKILNGLSKIEKKKAIKYIHDWKQTGAYVAIEDAKKVERGGIESTKSEWDLKTIFKRNEYIDALAAKSKIKVNQPIERGMSLSKKEALKFVEKFKIGKYINFDIPSGFSADPSVSRSFADVAGRKASILIKVIPNKNNEISGFYIDAIPDKDNDRWHEAEVVRSREAKNKVKNIIQRKYKNKLIIEIHLEEVDI